MRKYELAAIYGRNKSYYGKAIVTEYSSGEKILQSYKTEVARITANGDFIRTWAGWSATTARHINEFRQQNGLRTIGKVAWNALPVERTSPARDIFILMGEHAKLA